MSGGARARPPRLRLVVLLSCIVSISHATFLPDEIDPIQVWDKNGGLLINGSQSTNGRQYSWWYHDHRQDVRTRVSNTSILNLTPQESKYGEYYLEDDLSQSVLDYKLVVPSSTAGSPYESDFLSLYTCRLKESNNVEFWLRVNINERAIDKSQHCDLLLDGLPHCAFVQFIHKPCTYNITNLTVKFSGRCRLYSKNNHYFIISVPMRISQVDDLPLCPSQTTANTGITTSTTSMTTTSIASIASDTSITSKAMQPTPTSGATQSTTVSGTTQSTTASGATQSTPTSGATQSTPTSGATQSTPTFDSEGTQSTPENIPSEQTKIYFIAVGSVTAAIAAIMILIIFLSLTVYCLRRKSTEGKANSNYTGTNIRLHPQQNWVREIEGNQVAMAESLATVISTIVMHLRPFIGCEEYYKISSEANVMEKVHLLLSILIGRKDKKLMLKFCEALEKANHHRWTYLREYCDTNDTELYDA